MATERILPAIAVGARPIARPAVRPHREVVVRHAHPVAQRREAIITSPARAGMLIGASAAVYAVTLAGVAGLQARTDAETAANRAPYVAVVAETRAANDRLQAAVTQADTQARALAADYGSAAANVTAYQARIDALAALVAKVQGSAAALPAQIALPSVTMHGAVASSSGGGGRAAPATSSTTSASAKP